MAPIDGSRGVLPQPRPTAGGAVAGEVGRHRRGRDGHGNRDERLAGPHADGVGQAVGVFIANFEIEMIGEIAHDRSQTFAQVSIGADTAGHHQAPVTGGLQRAPAFFRESLDYGFLESARHIRSGSVVQNAVPQGY